VQIELQNIGKKYHQNWIFKDLTTGIPSGSCTLLLGNNGSGKSTLLKIFSSYLSPTEGLIVWRANQKPLELNDVHTHIAMCAPYQSPFPEFTLRENFDFYASFKPMHNRIGALEFARLIELEHAIDRTLSNFSSGMLQRVKLGLAIFSDVPLLLLDEPTSHLDKNGQDWYHHIIHQYRKGKTLLIATNEPEKDAPMPAAFLNVRDYMP
jgi:ABC-type multidrug transport system ATPase subunit